MSRTPLPSWFHHTPTSNWNGHRVRWTPEKVRFHSSELSCDVLKVPAYRGRCACGWVSPKTYATVQLARNAAHEHRLNELGID